jgi:hypothetical protein
VCLSRFGVGQCAAPCPRMMREGRSELLDEIGGILLESGRIMIWCCRRWFLVTITDGAISGMRIMVFRAGRSQANGDLGAQHYVR